MGFINLGRLNIPKRNMCASALFSLSDFRPPSVYKFHILNGPIKTLYINKEYPLKAKPVVKVIIVHFQVVSQYRVHAVSILSCANVIIMSHTVSLHY